jgi:hypothetical protein
LLTDLSIGTWIDLSCSYELARLLTFACHSVRSATNQLTGSIPSEVGELSALTVLVLRTWIGLSFVGVIVMLTHISLPFCADR